MNRLPRAPGWRTRLHDAVAAPMTSGAKRAFATLLVIAFVIGGANLLFTAREVGNTRAALAASEHAAASTMQLCLAGNTARAQQVGLWEHILAVGIPPPHETPAQRRRRLAVVAAFSRYVHHVFAPRNCHAITH